MTTENNELNTEKTNNLKPWEPGQSGNPGGRPKVAAEFREKCREFMKVDGWDKLMEIINNSKHKDRVRTLELIAGYAYGKPKQGVELSGEFDGKLDITITRI